MRAAIILLGLLFWLPPCLGYIASVVVAAYHHESDALMHLWIGGGLVALAAFWPRKRRGVR